MLALYIISGLLVLLLVVLSIPVDVRMRVFCQEKPGVNVSIRWLFGLIAVPVVPGKKREKVKRVKSREKPRKKGRRPDIGLMLHVVRTRGLFREVKRLVKSIIHRLRIRDIVVDGDLGLEDPADTGMLFAIIGPAIALCPPVSGSIRLNPVPDMTVVQGEIAGIMRIWPISLIPPLMRFVFSLPVLISLKTLLVMAWKNRSRV